jgi:hypothetical protein
VGVRQNWITGVVQRATSSTALRTSPGSRRSLSSSARFSMKASSPPLMALRVVSFPAITSRKQEESSSKGGTSEPPSRALARTLTMSSRGRARRSSTIFQKYWKSAPRALADESSELSPTRYSGSSAPTMALVQRNISFQSSRGTPSSSARTARVRGAATSVTKSKLVSRPARPSRSSREIRSMLVSRRRMARGVKWGAASLR